MSEQSPQQTDEQLPNSDVLPLQEVQDRLVRRYSADGTLYAYRSEDGESHIVVSNGREPRTRWQKQIPADQQRAVPGQKRWTIPESWQLRVRSNRNEIAYGLYELPDGRFAKVSIPTNNWLVDAAYHVKAVGTLRAEPVGEVASQWEVRNVFSALVEDGELDTAEERAFETVVDNWRLITQDVEDAMEWVSNERIYDYEQLRIDTDWVIEFQEELFRPREAIKRAIKHSDSLDTDSYETDALSDVIDHLREDGLIPRPYSARLRIDESVVDTDYYLRAGIDLGATPAQVVDWIMVTQNGMTQDKWAAERGVSQPTVSERVSGFEQLLSS